VIAQEITLIKHSRIKIIIAILMVLIVGTLFTPPLSAGTNGSCYYQFLPSSYLTQSDIKAVFKVWCDGAFLGSGKQVSDGV